MATKYAGFGAEIYVLAGSPTPSPTQIPGLRGDPPLSGETAEQIDVTSHDSPDRRREWLGGLIDGDERTLEFFYDPSETTHELLRASVGEVLEFQVDHPAFTDKEEFEALVTNAVVTAEQDGALILSVTLKPTGPQAPVGA